MKPRFYPYLELLLLAAVLAAGVGAHRRPDIARRCLDAVTLFREQDNTSTVRRKSHAPPPAPSVAPRTSRPVPRAQPVAHSDSMGTRIAAGHAFAKHGREFGFATRDQMAAHIDRIVASPSASRALSRGRRAYWHESSGTVVIYDPSTADGGTAFKPNRGRHYYEGLR
jgi:hypothetical protein